jgi:RimJ/RimL family protein N-acetyltransferase
MLPDTFETARLLLRPIAVEDAEVIFDTYAQDKEVARYVSGDHITISVKPTPISRAAWQLRTKSSARTYW